jgi:hypothetical protein
MHILELVSLVEDMNMLVSAGVAHEVCATHSPSPPCLPFVLSTLHPCDGLLGTAPLMCPSYG